MQKKNSYYFYFLIFFFTGSLFGEIVEIEQFVEIENYIDQDTLLVLDIDDTLIVPKQMLGNDEWFQYRYHQLKNAGLCNKLSLEKALADWEAIRHLTEMRLVETTTERVIHSLQNKNISIIGLSTQGLTLSSRTSLQLRELKINLSVTAISQDDYYFINELGVLYHQGVLYTAGTHKGNALMKLLALTGYKPKKIVFVNDKKTHLVEVENAIKKMEIPFIGLRYGFSDTYKSEFNPEITEVQFAPFKYILSDQEAESFIEKIEISVLK